MGPRSSLLTVVKKVGHMPLEKGTTLTSAASLSSAKFHGCGSLENCNSVRSTVLWLLNTHIPTSHLDFLTFLFVFLFVIFIYFGGYV